jgi:TonB family protein
VTPVEILFKPHPLYAPEARRLKIEGEVLVELLFAASGEARVLRVVRGLGHGLDENAIEAAHAIRFRPAKRGGEPTDSTAIVHIIFQLAY